MADDGGIPWVDVVAVVISAVSAGFAWNSNHIANEAKKDAKRANELAAQANSVAKQANHIAAHDPLLRLTVDAIHKSVDFLTEDQQLFLLFHKTPHRTKKSKTTKKSLLLRKRSEWLIAINKVRPLDPAAASALQKLYGELTTIEDHFIHSEDLHMHPSASAALVSRYSTSHDVFLSSIKKLCVDVSERTIANATSAITLSEPIS